MEEDESEAGNVFQLRKWKVGLETQLEMQVRPLVDACDTRAPSRLQQMDVTSNACKYISCYFIKCLMKHNHIDELVRSRAMTQQPLITKQSKTAAVYSSG